MNTTYLREFTVLAGCTNFTDAARQLNITQPTLSKHIAAIERELGCDLFVRDKQGVRITPAGIILLRRVDEALHALDTARIEVKSSQSAYGLAMDDGVGGNGGTGTPDARLEKACLTAGRRFGLSMQETDALALYLRGCGIREVGIRVGASRDEAGKLLGNAYRKLGVSSKDQALELVHSILE